MMEKVHVAIDGPVASGKGVVSREIARRMGMPFFDTGVMYRAVGVFVRMRGIDYMNEDAVVGSLGDMMMEVFVKEDKTHIFVNGVDYTEMIRENEASIIAGKVASYKDVRKFLVAKMQEIAKGQSFVVEGRDIASVVLPNARYKFFLTASVDERVRRRMRDLQARGENVDANELRRQIEERDRRDYTEGGLKQVEDAILIDGDGLSIEETVDRMLCHMEK